MFIRKSSVAGQFYPDVKEKLEETISSLIKKSGGSHVIKNRIKALILPHAGYMYSGLVAAETVSGAMLQDTLIILGPNHTGLGKPFSVMTEGRWQTPLGEIDIDSHLAKELISHSNYLTQDTAAHDFEHSIEVLLPFLQFSKKDIKFVPIIISHANNINIYKNIAKDIVAAVNHLHLKDKITVIASSDMTHYESQESASKKDHYAIEAIVQLDTEDLLKRVQEQNISMCGIAPVCVMLEAIKSLGATEAKLIRYQTSGDVTGDYNSVVGYAGISIN